MLYLIHPKKLPLKQLSSLSTTRLEADILKAIGTDFHEAYAIIFCVSLTEALFRDLELSALCIPILKNQAH